MRLKSKVLFYQKLSTYFNAGIDISFALSSMLGQEIDQDTKDIVVLDIDSLLLPNLG